MLTEKRQGVTLVTLALERVPEGFIAKLTAGGARVALGHSMATYAQTSAAMAEAGPTGFTHLFKRHASARCTRAGTNWCGTRSCTDAWYSLIVDGDTHTAPAMLRSPCAAPVRPIPLVTDAMPPVGGSRSSFDLCMAMTISISEGRCLRKDGTFASAYLDMATAVRNCVRCVTVSLRSTSRLHCAFATAHPAQFIGLGQRLSARAGLSRRRHG